MATLKEITQHKRFPWMAGLTAVATLGGVLIALNAFTGLNLRPAWGFEVEELTADSVQVQELLRKATDEREVSGKAIIQLRRNQLDLKVEQIKDDQRELRRDLTRQRVQRDEYRQKAEPVPEWLDNGISDTDAQILELENDKKEARDRKLELAPQPPQ
jgi:hypothetical protein